MQDNDGDEKHRVKHAVYKTVNTIRVTRVVHDTHTQTNRYALFIYASVCFVYSYNATICPFYYTRACVIVSVHRVSVDCVVRR